MPYTITIDCDNDEGERFAAWLRERGHDAKVGRITRNSINIDDPDEANNEMRRLWEEYCDS